MGTIVSNEEIGLAKKDELNSIKLKMTRAVSNKNTDERNNIEV